MTQVNTDRNKCIVLYKQQNGWGATIISGNDIIEIKDFENEVAVLRHIADIYEEAEK